MTSMQPLDLLANIESEETLSLRLKDHGCDIYAGGPYVTYADRLGTCIVRNGMQAVVVGRAPNGKPETYADCYQRLYGKALPKLAPKNAGRGQYENTGAETGAIYGSALE